MEKQGEIEKGKANNFEVSFSALRKDVDNVLDFMERLKNEEDQNVVNVYLIERLRLELAFICIYVQLSYSDLDTMTASSQGVKDMLRSILNDVGNNVRCKYNMDHVLPSLTDNIDDCVSSCHHYTSSATMTEEQLNFLLLNLHHISKYYGEQIFRLEILQNVCGNVGDFHGLIVNGCVEHKIVEYVLPQLQYMADRVGRFIMYSFHSNLAHLLLKVIPIELEVIHICFTNLRASTSAEVGRFIKNLLEISPDIL
ncbi:hypothetical protein FXO37_13232 [Capsicum annuum]|nr:hypothetical protein FXO37_13232 [Capsicum annuum]